jgi:hypothetical protein
VESDDLPERGQNFVWANVNVNVGMNEPRRALTSIARHHVNLSSLW